MKDTIENMLVPLPCAWNNEIRDRDRWKIPAIGVSWRRPIRREGRNPGRDPNGLRASCRDLQTRTKNQLLLAFLNFSP
jgi:hypothetical protein